MKTANKNILVLPRWYPNKTDIQLGIFIQRQLVLMETDYRFQVVYAQGLSDLKTKYDLVTRRPTPNLTEHVIYFKNAKGPLKKLINFQRYKKAQKIGLAEINENIDLCHVHVPYRSAIPALRLNRKKKIPLLITEHWSGHLNGLYLKKNAFDKMLYKKVLQKAAGISTVSRALQSAFKKNTGFDSVLIPNYIESQEIALTNNEKEIVNILSVGDFDDKTKNFSVLIAAFVKAHHLNSKLRLTIVGGGPDEIKIQKLVQQLKIEMGLHEETIQLTGRKEHNFVLKAMNKCHFYICNSNYETFGMTIAEALLAGKPVICTKCGGPEEFLNDSNSILIDLDSKVQLDQLVNAMTTMATSYSNYDSEKIRSEINTKFGKKTVHTKWCDFYTI